MARWPRILVWTAFLGWLAFGIGAVTPALPPLDPPPTEPDSNPHLEVTSDRSFRAPTDHIAPESDPDPDHQDLEHRWLDPERMRQSCTGDRCQLLVGWQGEGYEVFISHPRQMHLHLRQRPGGRLAMTAYNLRRSLALFGLLGAMLIVIFEARRRGLRDLAAQIRRARPCQVVNGRVFFQDGCQPHTALCAEEVADGPGIGLYPKLGDGWSSLQDPYRTRDAPRWVVLAGRLHSHLGRARQEAGITAALVVVIALMTGLTAVWFCLG